MEWGESNRVFHPGVEERKLRCQGKDGRMRGGHIALDGRDALCQLSREKESVAFY